MLKLPYIQFLWWKLIEDCNIGFYILIKKTSYSLKKGIEGGDLMKKLKLGIGILTVFALFFLLNATLVNAAPVYIDTLSDFPGYPYNSGPYENGVYGFAGCGPTTGAMILGYFEHHFGATGLLTTPGVGVDEGLDTAWELHKNYMNTNNDGFGSPQYIKPGMEDYAADRGYEIKVMVHYEIGIDPADVNTAWYGAYGDGWTDDVDWWIDLGAFYEIDDNKFCDYVEAKLAAGIAVWLSIDPGNPTGSDTPLGGADHWVPCVGVDKEAGMYYFYNTWDSSMHSEPIASEGAEAGPSTYAIGFLRTVEYIGPIEEEEHDIEALSQSASEVSVMPGDIVSIDVTVRNNGDFTETFDVTCEADGITVGTILVVDLAPGESRTLIFTWDTAGVSQGTYSIKATADPADSITEVDETNNECTMPAQVTIGEEPEEEHDIEALSQSASEVSVMPGDIVSIDVTVRNNGDFTESFDVTVTADGITIGTVRVNTLSEGASATLTFTWDTTGVSQGTYKIKAWVDSSAEIAEVDEANNECKMPADIFVIPELPLGTVLAVASMFAAFGGYIKFKRIRK
jgi:hypothetical protein